MVPWVEQHRPSSIAQVAHQRHVVATLSSAVESGNLPHLLFYGPPGTGKTSTILALAKDLYGPELYKSRVLELNASDERGIDVVRNKIKHFASLAVSSTKSSSYPCPPFKLVILDEADCMTTDAQSALRRTMETCTRVTRFCIICNYVSRIISPIASRCAKFRFQPVSTEVMQERLNMIAEKEGFQLPSDAADALIKISGGDLRRAITMMQNTYILHGSAMKGQDIIENAATIPETVILDLVNSCKYNSFEKIQSKVNEIIADGYPANQVVAQLHDWVMSKEAFGVSSKSKSIICKALGTTDMRLTDGSDVTLSLLHLVSVIMQALQTSS